jgi:hypothetical protein
VIRRLKLYFAVLGFCLAVVGAGLDSRAIVWAALISLGVSLALRIYLKTRGL